MLITKLHRPNVGPDLIYRDRLLNQLDQNIHQPLTLISAPSGYGKSVLVSQWIGKNDINAAWISLDDEIKSLRIFLEYFTAALKNVVNKDFRELEEFLQGQQLPPVETIFGTLVELLEDVDKNFVLILDDYQVVKDEEIHELINLFITYPVDNMHLMIICRRDPPLKFNQLRLYNRINEIRLSDLVFSQEDTRDLVTKSIDKKLSDDDLSKIWERAEGWVLGIQMILKTDEIRKVNETLEPIAHYSMSEYADFFADLVLTRLPEKFTYTLYGSSILARFNSELIDAVFEGPDSSSYMPGDSFIKELSASNLFIYSLDSDGWWFRYHHFFGDMLKEQLTRHFTEGQIAGFHKNASKWFEKNEYLDEAYDHAIESGDLELAVDIFDKNRVNFFNTDQFRRISRWLELLPEKTIEQHVGLLVSRSILDEAQYDIVGMKADLGMAQSIVQTMQPDSPENKQLMGEYYAMLSLLDFTTGKYENALTHANNALGLLEDKTQMISSYAFAFSLYALNALGRYEEAHQMVKGILGSVPKDSIPYIYTQMLNSYLNSFRGNLKEIAEAMNSTSALFIENKLWVLLSSVSYYLGSSHYQFNKLRKAVEYTEILDGHYYAGRPYWDLPNLYTKALALLTLGDTQRLSDTLTEIEEVTHNIGLEVYSELTKAFKVDLALRQGDIQRALELSETTDFESIYLDYAFYFQQLVYVRLLIVEDPKGNSLEIEEWINKYLEKGRTGHKYNLLMQVLLVQAVYLFTQGKSEAAMDSLDEAIDLSEHGGFIRIYLDLGDPMKQLLEAYQEANKERAFVAKILNEFEKEQPAAIVKEVYEAEKPVDNFENLSGREVETLQYISKGFRNKEIADVLNISVETVKSHVKNSLRKLGAKNRVELIRKAGMFELI